MRRTRVSASLRPLFYSMFLVASLASTPALRAQAAAAGTTVAVKMIDAVDSSKDATGQQYRASVTMAVNAGNGVMIPQGAIAAVRLANSGNGSGWTTQLVSVTVNGQPVAAAGSLAGGTSVATGQRVVLPPGTPLTFLLSQPPAARAASPATTAVAAASAPPAAAAGQQEYYVYCLSDRSAPVIYFSEVFVGKADPPSSGMRQTSFRLIAVDFLAVLQKKYAFKSDSSYPTTCVGRTSGSPQAPGSKQQLEDQFKQANKQIVETGWSG